MPRLPKQALRFFAAVLAACTDEPPAPPPPDPLASLRAFEAARRREVDFQRSPTSDAVTGPEPYTIAALPGGLFVGLLRNRDRLVLLGEGFAELARAPAPALASALAVGPGGDVFVAGEATGEIVRFVVRGGALARKGAIALEGVRSIRDLAAGPEGALYAVEERGDRLISLIPGPGGAYERVDAPMPAAPMRVRRVGDRLAVVCLLGHQLVVRRVDARGIPVEAGEARIEHDGPMWGLDAVARDGEILIALGGIEDHPLDRSGGSFGYIDSFAYLVRVAGERAERVASVNVSELGVVTPKALRLGGRAGETSLFLTGYGSAQAATLTWGTDLGARPAAAPRLLVPGIAALAARPDGGFVAADPLLDAWIDVPPDGEPKAVRIPDGAARSAASRLGEALFFTTLMAPWNRAEGELSRFTCEACHFEGYTDGRTHYTGRGDVRATTKPLLGLFNNRPHFSRALDPDLTAVAHNEFRVAGARSDHNPWFSVDPSAVPWLAHMDQPAAAIGPVELRRALMTFLMEFTHRPNPAAAGRSEFTPEERAGALVFQDRCEGCHAARLISDDAASRIPFEGWERLVLAREGAIVWGRDGYEKTGVEPYVHPEGARVPSLRRLYKKRPYFTNGSAKTLAEVLERVRVSPAGFVHAGGDAAPLSSDERAALLAFLELL